MSEWELIDDLLPALAAGPMPRRSTPPAAGAIEPDFATAHHLDGFPTAGRPFPLQARLGEPRARTAT